MSSLEQMRHDAMVGRSLRKRQPAIERRLAVLSRAIYMADLQLEKVETFKAEEAVDFIRQSLAAALRGGGGR